MKVYIHRKFQIHGSKLKVGTGHWNNYLPYKNAWVQVAYSFTNTKKYMNVYWDRHWGIVFQDVNVRHHIAINLKHLNEYDWNVLYHPPYSSDMVVSDFHLFMSLQISLNGWEFTVLEIVKHNLGDFFKNKPSDSFSSGKKTMAKGLQNKMILMWFIKIFLLFVRRYWNLSLKNHRTFRMTKIFYLNRKLKCRC